MLLQKEEEKIQQEGNQFNFRYVRFEGFFIEDFSKGMLMVILNIGLKFKKRLRLKCIFLNFNLDQYFVFYKL